MPRRPGFHHSAETRRKMSDATKGERNHNFGKPLTLEARRKDSESLRGRVFSAEHRRNLSKAGRGKPKPAGYGQRQSEARRGAGNPCWRGGHSHAEPYSMDWTDTLKRSIRERDHYTCRLCGAQQSNKAFDVHHIDYDKQHCDPTNLITLCHHCHSKTNVSRAHWIAALKQLPTGG